MVALGAAAATPLEMMRLTVSGWAGAGTEKDEMIKEENVRAVAVLQKPGDV